MLRTLATVPLLTVWIVSGDAAAQTDWPCEQAEPNVELALEGSATPSEEASSAWRDDPVIRDLTTDLAARRTPLEEAEGRIADFAASLDAATREEALGRLQAGIVETIQRERSSIITGISRFTERQEQLGARIQTINLELRELADSASSDAAVRRQALTQEREWDLRVFDERQGSLRYLCEQPLLLEERAQALASAISEAMQ